MHDTFWKHFWKQYRQQPLGVVALIVLGLFVIVGVYAPLFASSKPLLVRYEGQWYFPLSRYLFYKGFFTSGLDLFFNLLMFTLPCAIAALWVPKRLMKPFWAFLALIQISVFSYILFGTPKDPASDPQLTVKRMEAHQTGTPSWTSDLEYMNDYARLNMVTDYTLGRQYSDALKVYQPAYNAFARKRGEREPIIFPTLYEEERQHTQERIAASKDMPAEKQYLLEREAWLEDQSHQISFLIMPIFRPFHWEDDTGGSQALNQFVHWWQLTRTGGKDLAAALIFGIRISLVVGIMAVALALLIGVPVGALAGFYAGRTDIIVSRLMEIWESMPTFFMLLFVIAILQSKSIFLVIVAIGFFGWTGFSRYIRGEFFKQRNLPYVETCRAMGFSDAYVMFHHILPNAIPPLLTLLPFAVMGAITTEAGLSFLGLGEEGSCSWGVLMDEGRQAFPAESYLMWPPAILLTIMLIAIALVGDSLRDALDPRLHKA